MTIVINGDDLDHQTIEDSSVILTISVSDHQMIKYGTLPPTW